MGLLKCAAVAAVLLARNGGEWVLSGVYERPAGVRYYVTTSETGELEKNPYGRTVRVFRTEADARTAARAWKERFDFPFLIRPVLRLPQD